MRLSADELRARRVRAQGFGASRDVVSAASRSVGGYGPAAVRDLRRNYSFGTLAGLLFASVYS